jgi:hypothetical protein
MAKIKICLVLYAKSSPSQPFCRAGNSCFDGISRPRVGHFHSCHEKETNLTCQWILPWVWRRTQRRTSMRWNCWLYNNRSRKPNPWKKTCKFLFYILDCLFKPLLNKRSEMCCAFSPDFRSSKNRVNINNRDDYSWVNVN